MAAKNARHHRIFLGFKGFLLNFPLNPKKSCSDRPLKRNPNYIAGTAKGQKEDHGIES